MRTLIPALTVLLAACGGEAPHPQILEFTIDPGEVVAGGTLESTVVVQDFEFTGGEMDMSTMTGEGTHDHDHDHGDEASEEVQTGHAHIYLDTVDSNPLLMQTAETETVPPSWVSVRPTPSPQAPSRKVRGRRVRMRAG